MDLRLTDMHAMQTLTVFDHRRDFAGLTYVYPVVSRRAGGVSIGINLNPNNACNWRCIYCQVPDLTRGGPPPIDMAKLESELREFLHEVIHGSFMQTQVPAEARRLNDIALSGNGEPTSAVEFEQIIPLIGTVVRDYELNGKIKLVLITNGSLLQRAYVRAGLSAMSQLNGEVWFKVDSVTVDGMQKINGISYTPQKLYRNLRAAAALCPTWIQTCLFMFDGQPPASEETAQYLSFIERIVAEGIGIQGVLLYGLARPSMQQEAPRLSRLPEEWLANFAGEIERRGVRVKLST